MAATKIYLTVPFAQKDEAKRLGAKWDAAQKKWYVLEDNELSLFSKWQMLSTAAASINIKSLKTKTATSTQSNAGTITKAQHINFVAYNDELPPWH
jgi:hypothetical protein